ncbi:hypothetical protein THAOC_27890 [Thalassiosira oceanica]|uniref:Uncharacterized protein n=1 Tax=Thalassiosira oceanica TaxID=159749 RepID=K0S1P4_THAOC|nr:hypothetical protein THAOC_27890 [Thalassiosira oceanica]|eukprot:EJK52802.1 hypothetical protein THAOC_27890 [Thalassiosira oceanica]
MGVQRWAFLPEMTKNICSWVPGKMDVGPPLRGKDTAVEVDRGHFGKLNGSAFQPRSHIWALLRRIDLYFGNSDLHLFGFSPQGRNTPISCHSCAHAASAAAISAPDECHWWTGTTRSAPGEARGPAGGLSGSIFPKTGRFRPVRALVARSKPVELATRCFRETENRCSPTWQEDGRAVAGDKAE